MGGNQYSNIWPYEIFTFDVANGSVNTNRDHEQLVCEVYESSTGGGQAPSAYFTVGNTNLAGTNLGDSTFCVIPNNTAITAYFQGRPANDILTLQGFHVKVFDANRTLVTDISPLPEDPNNPAVISPRIIKFKNGI